ncbi:L-cysteine desulfidase family protein [Peptostreptococcus sp. D1]|uniref:L-cysteine desulfidase family protein n=1 Tax=Peptostreptococcus sp. D1 TaxID=72304 RepID=UPI0008E12371|nr:L-serine ammonia-lyase, iron-sulfur-dependent, subunit alpha [Peptostreptococcus sp. D1]SFE26164.1 L-cysteine desulfidase [Peptostreptococcus sp. D1]
MRDLRNEFVQMLKDEVKPAVGCTEPVSLALACAKCKELLGEEIEKNRMLVSPSIYKNGMCVGIPGTERLGLKIASAIGIVAGRSENGLSVLEGTSSEDIKKSEALMDQGALSIEPADTKEKVYILVEFWGKNNYAKVIIRTKHDNFVFLQKNEDILLNNIEDGAHSIAAAPKKTSVMDDATLEEIVKNIESLDYEDIKFLYDGVKMNLEMAEAGLDHKIGIGVGYGIKQSIEDGILGDDIINNSMMLTAGASDARMAGLDMPVMSSNGSGNHGLTAILPIVAYNQKFPQSDERLCRALALSHLTTAYIKNFTGRLSAMCGCGVAAATGATAGIAWLMDENIEQIGGAIKNAIADLSGMICDGAKPGCALKLSTAASAAVRNALLAKQGNYAQSINGIVGLNVDETIRNLGRVSDLGMSATDETILDVMNEMNKVK